MAHPAQNVEIEGRQVRVTNLEKVMYHADGTTKGEVLNYYTRIASVLLPYVADRPVTRKRWPDGVDRDGEAKLVFFTKNLDSGTPGWVRSMGIQHADRTIHYPLVNDLATLIQMAQLAALELHVPQWRFDSEGVPQPPDRLVLDLDPGPGVDLDACAEVALQARELLRGLDMECVPVTSGSKGIHLYAALDGTHSTQAASDLAREIARTLERADPHRVTSQMKKELRPGKVFVDWSQNNGNKTTVAPYSLRGRRLPTVAAPRTWEELAAPKLANLTYLEVMERVEELGDLLAPIFGGKAAPTAATPRNATSDRLATYRSMRDREKTPEPVPEDTPEDGAGFTFVIQEHHARALHYDFRLEREGVLVSWAVPKNVPSTTKKNHLAVQTEDHPLSYGSFAGTIPAGEYGGGEVSIWDSGTYTLHKWRPGKEVIVTLRGSEEGGLGGPVTVALIHTGDGDGARPKQQWLMHRMAKAPDYYEGDSDSSLPEQREPMEASEAGSVPGDVADWSLEVEWDGSRALAYVGGKRAKLVAFGRDVSGAHREVCDALAGMAVDSLVLDGVLVGNQLCAFDLLELNGVSHVRHPYHARRGALTELIGEQTPRVQAPPALPGSVAEALEAAQQFGSAAVIAKRKSSVYQPGKRAKTWLRIELDRAEGF